MNTGDATPFRVAQDICTALERLCRALVRVDLDEAIAVEAEIARLVSMFDAATSATTDDRAAIEATVARGRAALLQCRRLGASFSSITRQSATSGVLDGYGRTGDYAALGLRATLEARV